MKIALLSNVNLDSEIRRLSKEVDIYKSEGYGNDLGVLLDPASSFRKYSPGMVFLIEDLMELVGHCLDKTYASREINRWFDLLEAAIQNDVIYYVSDTYLHGAELSIGCGWEFKRDLEEMWWRRLIKFREAYSNVRPFPYHSLIEKLGEDQAFSNSMWYMGKIPHGVTMQKLLCCEILRYVRLECCTAKKVLLLDLDNTLWGGIAGESDKTPLTLSEEGAGLGYKNLQRVLLQMKRQGVVLGIVSKNNESDALAVINNHTHMILRGEDFAIKKINWEAKHENILAIAEELNVGLDSIVFFDDSAAERQLIREMLPMVTVAEFTENPELLPEAMVKIYRQYFEKPYITKEDVEKTAQYRANQKRNLLRQSSVSFDSYLKNLQIQLIRVDAAQHIERLTQLICKTNQFHLANLRPTRNEVEQILTDSTKEVFLYQVTDCFGDNGIVAAAIMEYGARAEILENVMSCRVMGRKIEQAVVEDLEAAAIAHGYSKVWGKYVPSEKNTPVKDLYPSLGYQRAEVNENGTVWYTFCLDNTPERNYQLEKRNCVCGKKS